MDGQGPDLESDLGGKPGVCMSDDGVYVYAQHNGATWLNVVKQHIGQHTDVVAQVQCIIDLDGQVRVHPPDDLGSVPSHEMRFLQNNAVSASIPP